MLDSILKIIANYLFVQACIVIFVLPFYYLYRRKYVAEGTVKVSYSQHLEYFFSSRYANWLVFAWAASEALFWFVIPEFLLLLLVFMRIRRKRELLYWDIYGTIAGTLIAYMIHLPAHLIDKLPYIQPKMIDQVNIWYNHLGIIGLLHQPFSGVPYKVFTHLATQHDLFLPLFLVFAVVVRISRYYIAYLIFTYLYPSLHKYVYRNYVRLVVAATFIFSLLLLKISSSYGASYHVSMGVIAGVQNLL